MQVVGQDSLGPQEALGGSVKGAGLGDGSWELAKDHRQATRLCHNFGGRVFLFWWRWLSWCLGFSRGVLTWPIVGATPCGRPVPRMGLSRVAESKGRHGEKAPTDQSCAFCPIWSQWSSRMAISARSTRQSPLTSPAMIVSQGGSARYDLLAWAVPP